MAVHTVHPGTTELDAYTARELARRLDAYRADDDLIVDLEGVTFCDSTAMGVLADGWRRQRAGGGSFAIVNVSEPVTRWFGSTLLLDVLTADT